MTRKNFLLYNFPFMLLANKVIIAWTDEYLAWLLVVAWFNSTFFTLRQKIYKRIFKSNVGQLPMTKMESKTVYS